MTSRHSASRRRSYGRREHEMRERAHEDRRLTRDELSRMTLEAVDANGFDRGRGEPG